MMARLFAGRRPTEEMRILDPGCGDGEFIEGVIRWCRANDAPIPQVIGVELDPRRSRTAEMRFRAIGQVRILNADFLSFESEPFDLIVGNPPYVSILELGEDEKHDFRSRFETASGRFDLYFLFWEKALSLLKPDGRLVYITPEKFLTVDSARPLRRLLARRTVSEIVLLPENTFSGFVTYPAVTTVNGEKGNARTQLQLRTGETRSVCFPADGSSFAASLYGNGAYSAHGIPLERFCSRISCGVATGADKVFVQPRAQLADSLLENAYPTVSGRQLAVQPIDSLRTVDTMLVPYDAAGKLIDFSELNGVRTYLLEHRARLERRTCVAMKPWYAFHETPPMTELLRPKILCRDVSDQPRFWKDVQGKVIPRHSVYYIIPSDPRILNTLAEYLNGPEAAAWLTAHCQRAANGYLRLQSSVLKKLPIPKEVISIDGQSY